MLFIINNRERGGDSTHDGLILTKKLLEKRRHHNGFSKNKAVFHVVYIINGSLLIFSVIIGMAGLDRVVPVHSKLFQIPRESLNEIYYCFIGLYKIVWLVFNAVPYAALLIIGKR